MKVSRVRGYLLCGMILAAGALLFVGINALAQPPIPGPQEITITTYYPAPYGVYNELTTRSNTYLATDSGNVGIGTTSPAEKLDVNGVIKAKGLVLHSAKMLRANSTQAIPSGTNTKINFDTEDYDIGDVADTTTDKFVISQPGRYLVTASWGTLGAQNVQTQVWINGVLAGRQYLVEFGGVVGDWAPVFTSVYNLNAGDEIEMYVFAFYGVVTRIGADAPQMTVTQLN